MQHPKLTVAKRTITGKKVKKLRKEGILPANIYGKDIKSIATQLPAKDFKAVFAQTGETGLIDLKLGLTTHPVIIHNVQKDYKKNLLHADFYQVNLKEKIISAVPVELTGESKAVKDGAGLLLHQLNEVDVEALPSDLPEKIEVNMEKLSSVGDQITVSDIKMPIGVTIKTDPSYVVVKIGALITKEAEEETAAEETAAIKAKEDETMEGAAGGEKKEEGQTEEKQTAQPKEENKEPSSKP